VGQDDKSYQLELSIKPGIETDTPKVMMWVDKTRYFMTKAEYFDASGQKQKTQLREDYKADSPRHWQPMKITILNNRTDRKSEIVFTETEIDKPLPDDLFSQRSLLRGN
jgi:outer membrane lipoprotein-sorting protein